MTTLVRTNQQEAKVLEDMIDGYSLAAVLDILQEVCFRKSDNVAVNWQDVPMAKRWATIAHRIDQVRGAAFNLEL